MQSLRAGAVSMIVLLITCALCGPERAQGELKWQHARKELLHVRLVALAWNHPRSSVFESEEVFIAEKQLDKDETQLVKLVFEFLPYQPRLSDSGLNYSLLHEMRAARDAECDETLAQLMNGQVGDWKQEQSQLKYSTDAPPLNPARHKSHLPCYVTDADDYGKAINEPAPEPTQ